MKKILLTSLILPLSALAQNQTVFSVKDRIISIFQILISIAIALAALLLMFGIVKYISKGDDPSKRSEGIQLIVNGIIGLLVMTALWGFVELLTNTIL
jgi:hypothetical protein